MNSRDRKDDRLLADTFHENWESGVPAQFARAAAAHARNRRRRRHALGSITAIAAVVVFVFHDKSQPSPPLAPAPSTAANVAATRGYEIISDAELLAQLRDRP